MIRSIRQSLELLLLTFNFFLALGFFFCSPASSACPVLFRRCSLLLAQLRGDDAPLHRVETRKATWQRRL